MLRRHIIVEGPDGSGKDGLIKRLLPLFKDHRLHVRASTSLGGPIPTLTWWLLNDMRHIDYGAPWIYNRHPLISEPIYAPIARRCVPQGSYGDPVWVSQMAVEVAKRAVVVWCLPPWSVVHHNVTAGGVPHMRGVAEHIEEIYDAYTKAMPQWPGPNVRWDYSTGDIANTHHQIRMAMD